MLARKTNEQRRCYAMQHLDCVWGKWTNRLRAACALTRRLKVGVRCLGSGPLSGNAATK